MTGCLNLRKGVVWAGLMLLTVVASCAPIRSSLSGIAAHPNEIKEDSVQFSPKKPERWELPNGLVVFYQYDDELPLVQGQLYLTVGSVLDPKDLAGIASATGHLMRLGGTKSLAPDKLDVLLDSLGASISSRFSHEYGVVEFSSLAEDFETVFPLFYQVTAKPRFDSDRLAIWKHLVADSILRRRESAQVMAAMVFNSAVYGSESPYARSVTSESLQHINRNEIKSFHARYVRPLGAHLAISGAVKPEQLRRVLAQTFGEWRNTSIAPVQWPKPNVQLVPSVYVLNRKFDQAQIIMGHLGPNRLSPDHHAIVLFNRMFGFSGSESLLFREIRTKEGLVYSVFGGLIPGRATGTFEVQLGTRNAEALNAIERVTELTQQVRETVFDTKDVSHALSSVERSFVFKFPSAATIVNRAAVLEHLGYSEDYDEHYLSNMFSVTAQSVQEVACRWTHPERFITVIVGEVSLSDVRNRVSEDVPVFEVGFEQIPKMPSEGVSEER